MCGLVSIFSYSAAAPAADRAELLRIREHMEARGPDGTGEWFSEDGRVGLGHRRLAIIDPGERGAQPMASADGRLVIVFNGEIYNFRALKAELEAQGVQFRTQCDTEVLLHLYARDGQDMVNSLRGMFAFALWDSVRGGLFLARDPYGIKPLYLADDGRTVRVASQVKALLAGGQVPRSRDLAGVAGFYLLGSVPEPFTLYSAIRAVPAGTTVWVDEKGVQQPHRWFSVAGMFRAGGDSTGPIEERVSQALDSSVRAHLVSDVPVGVFLSAGVDSAAVLAFVRRHAQQAMSLTLGFEEFRGQGLDELPGARAAAARFGGPHVERLLGTEEFQGDLERIRSAMDQPSIDGINTWFISKAAAEQGLKVVLSGVGGDELFGGYPSFRDVPRWVARFGPLARRPRLAHALWLGLRAAQPLVRWVAPQSPLAHPKATALPLYSGDYAGAWFVRRGLFMPWELPGLMGKEAAREGVRQLELSKRLRSTLSPDPATPYGRVAALESAWYLRNQLLRDADWAGMAHGVEIRTPLVDADLLRSIGPSLAALGHVPGKAALVGAVPGGLPEATSTRPKTGFVVPMERWLRAGRAGAPLNEHWSRAWARQLMEGMGAAA